MEIDDSMVEKYEEKTKSLLRTKIIELSSKISDVILRIQKTGNLESELPNIAITLNNKLLELQREFQKAGLSMYSQKNETHGYVDSSFVGDAIMQEALNYVLNGVQNLDDFDKEITEINTKKVEQTQALEKVNPLRKFFARIRNFFAPVKQENALYTQEEISTINTHLSAYKDTDQKLWNFNLKDNIIPSLVRSIREQGFRADVVPGLLEECVITELQKLGLADLIPDLKEALIEEYKKDIPVFENYQLSEEDMQLYVPDFKKEKNNELTETDLEDLLSKAQKKLSNSRNLIESVKENLIKNGISIEDFESIDETVNALERQAATQVIKEELQPVKEKDQSTIQESTDISIE